MKVNFTLLFLLLSQFIFGQQINENEIFFKVASSFLQSKDTNKKIAGIDKIYHKGVWVASVVNLQKNGWILLSNSYDSKPILAYNFSGSYSDEKPPALQDLIESYYGQLYTLITKSYKNKDYQKQWKSIMNSNNYKSYYQGFSLLNLPKGYVRWAQAFNNDGGCTPCYNKYCPESDVNTLGCAGTSSSSCYCDHKWLGCAAVSNGTDYVVLGMA